MTYSLI